MSDASRALRLTRIGSFIFLLALMWCVPGCRRGATTQGTTDPGTTDPGTTVRILLDEPPIRVKNQKFEVELLNDEWEEDHNNPKNYKPQTAAKKDDFITVIALNHNGTYYCAPQPFPAKSVTIVYGPKPGSGGGSDKGKVTFTVEKGSGSTYRINADFPEANKNKDKLEVDGTPNTDFLRSVKAKRYGTGNDFDCDVKDPTDDMLVYLY